MMIGGLKLANKLFKAGFWLVGYYPVSVGVVKIVAGVYGNTKVKITLFIEPVDHNRQPR